MGEIEKVFNFETFLTGGGIALILGLLGGWDAMLLPVLEEPQPSEKLLAFKEKYLG